jgi:hypothetical protein
MGEGCGHAKDDWDWKSTSKLTRMVAGSPPFLKPIGQNLCSSWTRPLQRTAHAWWSNSSRVNEAKERQKNETRRKLQCFNAVLEVTY